MVGRKKRKEDSSSDSDDEVLSKMTKKNVGKKNGSRPNNKRRSSAGKTKANVSDEESNAEHDANDSEAQEEEEGVAEKSKSTNGKRKSGRSNKNSGDAVVSRPKRNAEASKESSKKRTETNKDQQSSDESSQENDRSNASEHDDQNGSQTKRASEKQRKKKPKKAKKEKEEEYEVEKIIDFKIEDKTKFFLVRWKGYDSGSDSWVARRDLHCTGIIAQFYEQRPEASITTHKRKKKAEFSVNWKRPKKTAQPYPRPLKIDEQPDYDSEAFDENQEWKVERIVDVRYHRGNKRDFLIRWEGFSSKSDSWEPEENLDCKELIKKFTAKLEVIVSATVKDLRPVRKQTQRYTVMDIARGRRLSKRFDGRQRASYYDCEE